MNRTLVEPRPRLVSCERQNGCKHAKQDGQGKTKCRGGRRLVRVLAIVRALLDELEVVIGERPEERFGNLERTSVVVIVIAERGLGDDRTKFCQHRQIDRVRDCVD